MLLSVGDGGLRLISASEEARVPISCLRDACRVWTRRLPLFKWDVHDETTGRAPRYNGVHASLFVCCAPLVRRGAEPRGTGRGGGADVRPAAGFGLLAEGGPAQALRQLLLRQ